MLLECLLRRTGRKGCALVRTAFSLFDTLHWRARILAVYPTPDGHHRISAVGTHLCEQDLNHIKVPTDGNESELLTFEIPEPPRDMNTVDDLKGVPFVIHDACWNILKGYSYKTPIPLDQLADVLSDTWGRYFQDVSIEKMNLKRPHRANQNPQQ